MPVLIVSEKTWLHEGFSRNRSIRPSSSVTTIPNSSGLSTDLSPIVTAARQPDRTRRPERRLLDRVLDREAQSLAAAEVAADRLRQECDRDDHVFEAVPLEQLEDVLHARLADDRHHRLRLVRGERAQARPLAARHDDRLHAGLTSRRALSR